MPNTLKIKRGLASSIPQGQLAEPLFTTDTYDLYIGKGSGGNQRIQNYIASGTTNDILRGDGSVYTFPLGISSPSAGQVLKYNGTTWVNDSDAGITGTGTTNTLPKFTGATTLGNSNVTDSGSLITLGSTTYINGDVGIGTNNPLSRLEVRSSSGYNVIRSVGVSGSYFDAYNGSTRQGSFGSESNGDTYIGTRTSNPLIFTINGAEVARFGTNGALGIGTTSLTGYTLRVSKNISRTGASYSAIGSEGIIDDTATAYYFNSLASTANTTFTLSNLYHYAALQGTKGASSTINNQFGFFVDNTLTGATNNYGFYGNIASGTNRWNLYMNGTAANYLAGSLNIGTTSVLSDYPLNVQGTVNGNLLMRFANTSSGTSARLGLILNTDFGTLGSLDAYGTAYNIGSTDDIANGVRLFASGAGGLSLRASNASGTIRFYNGSTESARFGTNGALGIGTTSLTGYSLRANKALTGNADVYGIANTCQANSDATSTARSFYSEISTQAASYTLSGLYHYWANQGSIGAGSTVTSQFGFFVHSSLVGATNNFGFYGNIPSGTNRWNLYMNGTAANYLNGSLGISATALTGITLGISKNITGATNSYGTISNGTVQSDVTSNVYNFNSSAQTAAAAFTLANYFHYAASQGLIGAGSAITTQTGFWVDSSFTAATNNRAFRGSIAAATNAWNLYMDGTANNYMAGSLGIGTTSVTGNNLIVNKNITGSTNPVGIYNAGTIQSDATGNVSMYATGAAVVASAFTVNNIFHYNSDQLTIGAGATVTTQVGFRANNTLVGAGTNYGFQGRIPAQANAWNLYMDGTANNYLAGSLGIGSTSLTGYTLRLAKSVTGATNYYGIESAGTIQSDVTSSMQYFQSVATTQATTFTLGVLRHYFAFQGSFGAGSTVTSQIGYLAHESLIGATNNFGFYGNIPAAANRWNLYMNGTAANYLAGDLYIGTTSATATFFRVNGSKTASSAIARGALIDTTLVAAANNDVLVGLDINPTFTNGAFTGVTNLGLRVAYSTSGANNLAVFRTNTNNNANITSISLINQATNISSIVNLVSGNVDNQNPYFAIQNRNNAGTVNENFRIWQNGNITIQNGGTYTDNGFRLDVQGTSNFNGNITHTGYFLNTLYVQNTLPITYLLRINGTVASPTSVINGDILGQYRFSGQWGSVVGQFNTSARIEAVASENFTSSNNGSILSFFNTTNGSNTQTERLRIFNNGNILIQNGGTFTDAGFRLDVNGTGHYNDNLRIDQTTTAGYALNIVTPSGGNNIISILRTGNISATLNTVGSNAFSWSSNWYYSGGISIGILPSAFIPTSGWLQVSSGISIGNSGNGWNASAVLDVASTTKGFLQPRMTTTQRDAISTPATGLKVYNTTTNTNDYYNGTSWLNVGQVIVPANNQTGISISGSSLTGTNAQSLLDLSQTWNTTGYPTAIKLNITNTASGILANLMDLQVGGATQFLVDKAGAIKTSAPSGGTAGKWKLGSKVTATVALVTTDYIELEVDGVAYKVGLVS